MYKYFDAYEDNKENNRSSQLVELLDEEENDILNSNDNYYELYGEFDEDNEDNESIIEQVKCIKLSGYSEDSEYNEKLINETIKQLHRLNDFKRIKQIHFVNQLGDHIGSHGLQCIIEYEIADAHISWD